MKSITITMTCKPFSTEPRAENHLSVTEDCGEYTVRVYDSIAGHYTLCHSLTARSQSAAVRKAKNIWTSRTR